MPVGKRRKSSQSECSNREKQGARMTTDPSNAGVEEKQGASKDAVAQPATLSQQRSDSADASLASGSGKEKEKTDDVPVASLPVPVMPVPTHMSTRSSTRVIKRPRRDTQSPTPSPVKKPVSKEAKTGTPETKTKRQWELWGNADKNTFFDGLYEFGKDFDAIQGLIANKCKRKGVPPALIKNKDQVRHFYYRTWHKISKYIHFSEGVKKQTQELYGLINYGELRKRIGGSLDERYLQKLNLLIHKGSMYVRIKGKNHRVRTPVCNALKKLNQVEEPKADNSPKVPTKVTLEIGARTNAAWAHVQELAQNPRLRITLKASHRFSSVISFLEKKWKPQRLRIKESLDTHEVTNKQLRLFPHKDCQIHPISLKTAHAQVRPELHFDNYKENILGIKPAQKEKEVDGVVVKSESSQSGPEANVVTSPENTRKIVTNLSVLQSPGILLEDENAMFPDDLILPCSSETASTSKADSNNLCSVLNGNKMPFQSVISVDISLSASQRLLSHNENATDVKPGTSGQGEITESPQDDADQVDIEERIRRGWSLGDCEYLSLAELYLMFGDGGKLRLEYDWCDINPPTVVILQQLTNLLRRLVHLATTEFTDFSKQKQESQKHTGQPPTLCQKCSAPISGGTSTLKSATNKSCAKNAPSKSTASPSNKSAKKPRASSPESRDPVFRVPASVLTQGIPPHRLPITGRIDATAAQADMLLRGTGQYRKNRAPLRKPMIVKRRLLPKAHVQGHQLMTLTMVPTSTMAGTAQFLPMGQAVRAPSPAPVMAPPCIVPQTVSPHPSVLNPASPVVMNSAPALPVSSAAATVSTPPPTDVCQSDSSLACQLAADLAAILPSTSTQDSLGLTSAKASLSTPLMTPSSSPTSLGQSVFPQRVPAQDSASPPSISSLLDMSFSNPPSGLGNGEKILDMVMGNSMSGYSDSNQALQSPFKLSDLGTDGGWLGAEVADISLSGFLESPEKRSADIPTTSSLSVPPPNLFSDASRDLARMDVDSTLQCMLNESSMDYAAKFADIAAQMAASVDSNRKSESTGHISTDTVQ